MSTSTISNNASGDLQVENADFEALMALAIKQIDRECLNMPKYESWLSDKLNPEREVMDNWRKLALRIADMVE